MQELFNIEVPENGYSKMIRLCSLNSNWSYLNEQGLRQLSYRYWDELIDVYSIKH